MREFLPTIDAWLASGQRIALASVVRTWGSTPRPAGSHMLISERGQIAGSVSGGCVEAAVVEAAGDVLRSGIPRMLEFSVSNDLAWDVGLACGGSISIWLQPLEPDCTFRELAAALRAGSPVTVATVLDEPHVGARIVAMAGRDPIGYDRRLGAELAGIVLDEPAIMTIADRDVFVQTYAPPTRLLIVGAVHTAIPLATLGKTLGYHVTVIDPRAAFTTRERFPDADQLLLDWPDTALEQLRPDSNSAVVVLSHDPKLDEPALSTALRSDAGYIGAVGSRATSADRLDRLRLMGFSDAEVDRIHGPIGLDLGATTPEEIALAILAEIVATRHQRAGGMLQLRRVEQAV